MSTQQPTLDIIEWLRRNWLILAVLIIGLVLITQLMGRRRRIIIE